MSSDTDGTATQYVTAFFDTYSEADAAIERVVDLGVAQGDIRLVEGKQAAPQPVDEKKENQGFLDALADFFMPDEDRNTYAEGLNRGGYLVSVATTVANRDRVIDILDNEGTVDMEEREASWRADGWKGFRTDASVTGHITGSQSEIDTEEGVPVIRHEMRAGKRDVNAGGVRVRSYVVDTPDE